MINQVPSTVFLQRLQDLGLVTGTDVKATQAMMAQEPTLLVSEALKEIKHLNWDAFIELLCAEFGSESIAPKLLKTWPIQPQAIAKIPDTMARELGVFPLSYDPDKDRMLVLTAYPFNPHALEELAGLLAVKKLEFTFCDEASMSLLLQRGYLGEEDLFSSGHTADEGFDLGLNSDEEAFPGIYGTSVAEFIYQSEQAQDDMQNANRGGVHGHLADLNVVDMLQALGQSRKTCFISLYSSEHGTASIYLQDGFVVAAEFGSKKGPEAIYQLLDWHEGQFDIIQKSYDGNPMMYESVDAILLEGMRRLDEASRS